MLAPIVLEQVHWIIKFNIIPMVDNEEIVKVINKNAAVNNKIVDIHVKINTGLKNY